MGCGLAGADGCVLWEGIGGVVPSCGEGTAVASMTGEGALCAGAGCGVGALTGSKV